MPDGVCAIRHILAPLLPLAMQATSYKNPLICTLFIQTRKVS
ncbi:hypothetical protein CIT292_10165 [Citrobacter youngae ATCC 29220]|uniref:Uncharacterized protein n=1 Tax=Citrobacter youngae ATCC 29220 TaxID=500640 RepID=D4BI01_9ENTR|nr:hypothetical protein CIT292_10165 [Citrobacter youngae ATCC 29220]